MSFDHKFFQKELIHRLVNGMGMSSEIATQLSLIASDVIRSTHGGERHYIQARNPDVKRIKAAYAEGVSIATLSRRHGLTAKAIRHVVEGVQVEPKEQLTTEPAADYWAANTHRRFDHY